MPWDPYENKRPNPCKGCTDRVPGCQDHCRKPDHLAWKAEQEKIKEARHNYRPPIYVKRESILHKR